MIHVNVHHRIALAILWMSTLSVSALVPTHLYAQARLYGATTSGGLGAGTLFSSQPDGSDFRVEYAFLDLGYQPADRPVQASNALFYSVNTLGGDHNLGTIFHSSASGEFTRLHAFTPGEGQAATGLTEGPDGALYGMTRTAFYRLALDGTFTIAYTFSDADGTLPVGSLILGSDGYFYGSTSLGGANDLGTVFRIMPDGTGFDKLHDMTETDGGRPVGSLLEAGGALYGVALGTGLNWQSVGEGSVFRLQTDGTGFAVLHTFPQPNQPVGGLVQAPNGYLYGIYTSAGGGYGATYDVYKLQPDGTAYSVLPATIGIGSDRFYNQRILKSLMVANDNHLYGFYEGTRDGSRFSEAGPTTLFRIESDDSFTELDTPYDYHPIGSFIQGNDGYLYALSDYYIVTLLDGTQAPGSLFRIATSSSPTEHVHPLGPPDGGNCDALSLTLIGDYLYGTCRQGGASQSGTFFRYHLPSSTFQKLHDFSNGRFPGGKIALYNQRLYGLLMDYNESARSTGSYGSWVNLFSMALDGSAYTEVPDFFNLFDYAIAPWSGLILGSDGFLYFSNGGFVDFIYGDNASVVKAPVAGSSTEEILTFSYSLNEDGYYDIPQGFEPHELIEGSDGFLYMMTNFGGDFYNGSNYEEDKGTIVKVAKDGSMPEVLHHFNTSDGDGPIGGLVEGSGGLLYGMTHQGGTHGLGTLFSIHLDGSGFQKLYDFSTVSGGAPVGSLLLGEDGYLYGTTQQEGSDDYGTLFRLMTDGSGFQRLHDFQIADGTHPFSGLVYYDATSTDVRLSFEAECAEVGAHWTTSTSTLTSHGQYAYASSSNYSPTGQASDRIRFTFEAPQTDHYTVAARFRALGPNRNSFWVRLNGGAWQRWDLPVGSPYQWATLPFSGAELMSGTNHIDVEYREAHTNFDKLVVTDGSLPTDLGPEATNCRVDFTAYLEAECAEVGTNWQTNGSTLASHGAYAYSSTSHFSPTDMMSDRIRFAFEAPQTDHYTISARFRAISNNRNSFWIRLNDGAWQRWDLPVGDAYQWADVPFSGEELMSGTNTIDFEFREFHTNFDKLFITNTGEAASGMGSAATNCSDTRQASATRAAALEIYPNPTQGQFTLFSTEVDLDQAQVQVATLEGRVLSHVPVQRQASGLEIDLRGQPAGIYVIRATTHEQVFTLRAIKQ
ncbi:Por secretion system C-terminal sorting domain-containing protein [Catalinimonas alkaloidigena]|uniref:Por secretion system C-terminal sorting domain-containing protein n=1 Tax=Catalinimonas alkaloidigena TaxID=1075417 RepID=A0A1G9T2W0_9BACT|nr:choice-of-anchor tandem repeat GloVer-containing protein [Catalinimonas alkaloidigena]SDM41972.1 Por secretion system C-terminal sorting domain-containing protein [Catalinimonas alkaloidigena]